MQTECNHGPCFSYVLRMCFFFGWFVSLYNVVICSVYMCIIMIVYILIPTNELNVM